MIVLCLIRIAMLEASRLKNLSVAQISFARALTETRLFFKLLMSSTEVNIWPSIRAYLCNAASQHRVHYKPGRQFPRDRQEYRRKSRGLDKRRRGRKPKCKIASPLAVQPETRKDSRGNTYLLS